MQNKKIMGGAITAIIIACLSFWGGMNYGQGQSKKSSSLDRQGFSQNNGQNFGKTGMRGGFNGGFVNGSIIAKDDKSLTVELRANPINQGNPSVSSGGGSKIVLLAPTTSIDKSVSGALSDLIIGDQVTIIGTTNPDGSISATSVQIKGGSLKK